MTTTSTQHADAPPVRGIAGSTRRRSGALAFLGLAQLLAALDATIVNVALPSVQSGLHLSTANRQWVVTAYTLAFAGLVLVGGRIADYTGRKRAYLIAVIGFAAASAVGGAATSGAMLIAARAVQGCFAAVLAPTVLSLLAVTYTDAKERARAFAIYGAIAGSGAAVGLLLGGALTEYLSWRWCLFVSVPIAAIAAIGGWRTLPDPPAYRQRLDLPGVLASTLGLVALVGACTQAVSHGWGSTQVISLLTASAVLLVAFVVWESRATTPVLPLHIARNRHRIGAYVAVASALGGMLGCFLFLTYYLQAVRGYTPLATGLAFLPLSAAVQVGAGGIAARLLPRVAPRTLITPGLLLVAAGMALLTRISVHSSYAASVLPAELLLGLGMGLIFVPAISSAQAGVDPREAGIASALVNATQQAGGSIGTALLNTVATTASAAYAAAHGPGPAALVHGYTVAAAGTALALAGAALLVWTLLRPASSVARRPIGRRIQAAVFRVVNVPMRAALSLPVATPMGRRLMLVHHIGRKTGKHYRQPVSYGADGDALLTPGGGRWTRNMCDGQPVRVRLRGRMTTARPELIHDPDEVERLLTVMSARNPALDRFVRIPTTPDGRRDRDHLLRAIRYGFRVVRWHIEPAAVEEDQAGLSTSRPKGTRGSTGRGRSPGPTTPAVSTPTSPTRTSPTP